MAYRALARRRMFPDASIDLEIVDKPAVALLGVGEGHGVGAVAAERLDESLSLNFDSGRVALGADVPQT